MARFLTIVSILSAFFNNTPLVCTVEPPLRVIISRVQYSGCAYDAHRERLGPLSKLSKASAPLISPHRTNFTTSLSLSFCQLLRTHG
jgi:hypothetical protein